MTGFAKGGLPHTSNSTNLEGCNLGFEAHKNLKFSISTTYVCTHCCPNFKGIAASNVKLLIVNVGKLVVCGRPLFANPVYYVAESKEKKMEQCLVSCGLFLRKSKSLNKVLQQFSGFKFNCHSLPTHKLKEKLFM